MRRLWPWLWGLAACGQGLPPFEALPSRDALLASPELLSALPPPARRELGRRLMQEALTPTSREAREVSGASAYERTKHYDAALAARGDDAHLTLQLSLEAVGSARVIARPTEVDLGDAAESAAPLVLEGASADTIEPHQALEAAALAGEAGQAARAMMYRCGATRAARVVNWPAALVCEGDTLFVNAAWLVATAPEALASDAMSETPVAVSLAPISRAALRALPAADAAPVSYVSQAACVEDRKARCAQCVADASTCDAAPVLADFGDAASECQWLAAAAANPETVCRSLALQRSDVIACLKRNEPACVPGTAAAARDRASVEAVAREGLCKQTIEKCASDPSFTYQISCEAGCRACTTACVPSCASSCTTPSCSTPTRSCGSASCKTCSAAAPPARSPEPFIDFAALALPVVYLLARRRR